MNITTVEVQGGVSAVPGEKLTVSYGDILRINVGFDYRGQARTDIPLYGAIGQREGGLPGFDEDIHAMELMDLPESPNWASLTRSVDIPITSQINPGVGYDIECKIIGYDEAGIAAVDNMIDVEGIPPTWELLQHTIYPLAYVYKGEVEATTVEFNTDPFTPASWIAEQFAKHFYQEAKNSGARPLEVKVYADKTPLLWTHFQVEVYGIPFSSGIGIAWVPIIILALAVLGIIIAATFLVKAVVESFNPKPALHEAKPAFDRETLITGIQDMEEYWNRTPTPVSELEAMSDNELRDFMDQVAEEEVGGEGLPWLWIAVAGGIAALALLLTTGRKSGSGVTTRTITRTVRPKRAGE